MWNSLAGQGHGGASGIRDLSPCASPLMDGIQMAINCRVLQQCFIPEPEEPPAAARCHEQGTGCHSHAREGEVTLREIHSPNSTNSSGEKSINGCDNGVQGPSRHRILEKKTIIWRVKWHLLTPQLWALRAGHRVQILLLP